MKIMHVIHGLYPGGAETLVKDYVLNINKKIFEPVVICYDHIDNSPYEKILAKNNIRVIYICDKMPFYNDNNFFAKCINYIQKYILTRKIINIEKPDIIHTHLYVNKYIKYSKISKKCKLFHTVHSDPEKLWNLNNRKKQKDFKSAKWLVKNKNMKMIVLHKEMQKKINEMFEIDDSIILNNGINFQKFKNLKNKRKTKEELNIPSNLFIMGHVGRFSKVKNHEYLVKVFYEYYKKNNNAFLLMIGDGEEKNNIINLLNAYDLNKNYLILSNRDDIPDLLNIMDCFIFPSFYEGLSVSMIEAQKSKLLCFVSDTISDETIISNLVTMLSIDLTPEEWANKIINTKYPKKVILNDSDWDMLKIIKVLEKIYLN